MTQQYMCCGDKRRLRRPSDVVASLLKEKLELTVTLMLDQAHRTLGARRDRNRAPLRVFVVRCHYYTEKEKILKKVREMERTPEGQSGQIHIFLDYTQEVNSKRAAFTEASCGPARGSDMGCDTRQPW